MRGRARGNGEMGENSYTPKPPKLRRSSCIVAESMLGAILLSSCIVAASRLGDSRGEGAVRGRERGNGEMGEDALTSAGCEARRNAEFSV